MLTDMEMYERWVNPLNQKHDFVWVDESEAFILLHEKFLGTLPFGFARISFPPVILDTQSIEFTKAEWFKFKQVYRSIFRDERACATWFVPTNKLWSELCAENFR